MRPARHLRAVLYDIVWRSGLSSLEVARLLQVGQKLDAVVELDKEDYLVLSFPERAGVVGFAATSDLNLQAQRSFSLGQKLQATVVALPSQSTGRQA